MTARSTRLVGLAAAGTLVAGLVAAPPALGASGGAADPAFYAIGAESVTDSAVAGPDFAYRQGRVRPVAARAAVQKSKGEQILQVFQGIQGVGSNGLAVAAGPKHVLQVGGQGARVYAKNTGQLVGQPKTINQFFGIGSSVAVISQPTVVYDPIGRRWVAAAITDTAGDVGLVLRVSKSSTPTPIGKKRWYRSVRFADASTGDLNPDVIESKPQIGVSSNKIAITTVADDPSDPLIMNRNFFFPRGLLYNNASPVPGAWTADLNGTYDGQAPSVNASRQPNIFIAIPDTSDVEVDTYTGAAKANPPVFSKAVVFPTGNLLPPPIVDQGSGDDLDLGSLAFSSAAWRANTLWAAATVDCGGDACVRVFGIRTSSGVTLLADEKLAAVGKDWFSPALAIDGAGFVHLSATDVGSAVGPSQAVFARTGANKWTKPRFVRRGNRVVGSAATTDWWKSNSAALDPTSPWDVWVSGASGANGVPNDLTSRVARVSLARNVATLKASASSVRKGSRVTFKAKLARPGSKDVIRGLPVALQMRPARGGSWNTVRSGTTSANGTAQWTLKIKKPARYRTFGKAVQQNGGAGRVFSSSVSKGMLISLD